MVKYSDLSEEDKKLAIVINRARILRDHVTKETPIENAHIMATDTWIAGFLDRGFEDLDPHTLKPMEIVSY